MLKLFALVLTLASLAGVLPLEEPGTPPPARSHSTIIDADFYSLEDWQEKT